MCVKLWSKKLKDRICFKVVDQKKILKLILENHVGRAQNSLIRIRVGASGEFYYLR